MTEFVRIDAGNKRAASVNKAYLDGLAEKPTVIKGADALNRQGIPLADTRLDGRADKPRATVKDAAAKKAASSSGDGGKKPDPVE